jgi:hypothetical protein
LDYGLLRKKANYCRRFAKSVSARTFTVTQ